MGNTAKTGRYYAHCIYDITELRNSPRVLFSCLLGETTMAAQVALTAIVELKLLVPPRYAKLVEVSKCYFALAPSLCFTP